MARTPKTSRSLGAFTVPMKVQIRQPKFEPLTSLAALDLARLRKGTHKIEIGFLAGGDCRNLVRAVCRNGMVTGCEVEPCKDASRRASRELLEVLAKARRRIKARGPWKPIPVAALVTSRARMLDLIIIGGGCILICIWGHCILCCWWPRPHCFIPDIFPGPL